MTFGDKLTVKGCVYPLSLSTDVASRDGTGRDPVVDPLDVGRPFSNAGSRPTACTARTK